MKFKKSFLKLQNIYLKVNFKKSLKVCENIDPYDCH